MTCYDDCGVSLRHAVLHPLLAQVGVDGHHGQAVLEGRDGGGHPLGARVGVHHHLVPRLSAQLAEAAAEVVSPGVELLVGGPGVVAQLVLGEHLPILLLLLHLPQHGARPQRSLCAVLLPGEVPDLLHGGDLLGTRLQLVLDLVDHGHGADGDLLGGVRHDPCASLLHPLGFPPWLLYQEVDWVGEEIPYKQKTANQADSKTSRSLTLHSYFDGKIGKQYTVIIGTNFFSSRTEFSNSAAIIIEHSVLSLLEQTKTNKNTLILGWLNADQICM